MKFNDTQYYYQGYSSHQTGLPYESSPHPIGSPARLEWCRGWRDAENDYRKRLISNENDNTNQQFESLATRQDEGWNGEGLPPVDCQCEAFINGEWKAVQVAYYRKENTVDAIVFDLKNHVTFWADEFRPIRTEAERKREEAVAALKALKPQLVGQLAGILYDEIAAGKIPHIKLESDHE